MPMRNTLENFHMEVNDAFVAEAERLRPELKRERVHPQAIITYAKKGEDWIVQEKKPFMPSELHPGEKICFDFGNHYVGYVSLTLNNVGSPADAPCLLSMKLGELVCEIAEEKGDYQGSISSSWIQEDTFHIDWIPSTTRFERRYAFRYLEITLHETSPKYHICIEDIQVEAVSAVDDRTLPALMTDDPLLARLDAVSVRTMHECMQDVFEDGPKRDRRLWLGDLRLQALVNYETYRENDLVKRCLYLFAGLKQNDGRVGACLFTQPRLQVDDTYLMDYALFFISVLDDYYLASGDLKTVQDLYPTAKRQIEIALAQFDEDLHVLPIEGWGCFIDWQPELDKHASLQAILIYTLRQAKHLAEVLGQETDVQWLEALLTKAIQAAMRFYDPEKHCFVSGAERQVSWASQVWMVLAKVLPDSQNREVMRQALKTPGLVGMTTPYMHHHLVQALLDCDLKKEAYDHLVSYWGGMLEMGADTFFEAFDPENPFVSPYGSRLVNSYCHAWSGTPAYFIRKYFAK